MDCGGKTWTRFKFFQLLFCARSVCAYGVLCARVLLLSLHGVLCARVLLLSFYHTQHPATHGRGSRERYPPGARDCHFSHPSWQVQQRQKPVEQPRVNLCFPPVLLGPALCSNYTGNRVTCRDWFQLTLKEGLTVFRDQVCAWARRHTYTRACTHACAHAHARMHIHMHAGTRTRAHKHTHAYLHTCTHAATA